MVIIGVVAYVKTLCGFRSLNTVWALALPVSSLLFFTTFTWHPEPLFAWPSLACYPNHHTSFIYFYYFFIFWYQSLIFENFKFQFQFPKLQFLNLMFKTLILKSFSKFQFLSNLISKTPILKSFSKFQFLSNLISKIPNFFKKNLIPIFKILISFKINFQKSNS